MSREHISMKEVNIDTWRKISFVHSLTEDGSIEAFIAKAKGAIELWTQKI